MLLQPQGLAVVAVPETKTAKDSHVMHFCEPAVTCSSCHSVALSQADPAIVKGDVRFASGS